MDEQQKQDFAARLQRIQAQKAEDAAEAMEAEFALPPPSENSTDGVQLPPLPPVNAGGDGSGFGPVRIGMILIVLLALVGYGAFYLLEMADDKSLLARPEASTLPIGEIAQAGDIQAPHPLLTFVVARDELGAPGRRIATDRGWEHTLGSVATPDGAQVQVTDIATGFDPSVPDEKPGKLASFAPNDTCTLRRPTDGDVVRNVRFGHATRPTQVHAFSDAGMVAALITHTNAALFNPKSYEFGLTARGRLNRVDVFVTDTSGPVYLVLQSMGGNTLWNVHRGPGVRIAHVAMIGNTSGIVVPQGVSFEALRITDFVTNFEFGSNDEIRPCMIAPYRLPKPFWEGQQKAQKGNTLFENQMYTFNAGHRAFAAWYQDALGVDPETGLTEAEGAGHALVGPVPAGPLGYRSLAGQTVYITEADHLLIGDDAVATVHRDLMLAASGGDVEAVLPPVRRVQP
ncbi:MAG: hypothetical protein AAF222_10455 [Pseudomonadota bacterium]